MASTTTYTCDFTGLPIPNPLDVTNITIQWSEAAQGKQRNYFQKSYEICPTSRLQILALIKISPTK